MADTFSFPYMVMTITASIDAGTLTVKQGIRKFEMPIDRMRHLYVKRHGDQFQELIVAWEKSPEQYKHVRVFANLGAKGFEDLVEALAAKNPAADLRNTPEEEAYKLLRATNTEKVAMVAVPVILVLAMGVMGLPWLIHGLDHGHAKATVASLAATLPDTHNLDLVGELDLDDSMRETTTRKGQTTSRDFFPVVEHEWDPSQPVRVVLQTSRLSDSATIALAKKGSYPCTLRNVLWEGLSKDNREFFKKTYQLDVPDTVLLCEYAPTGNHDIYIFLAVIGVTAVVIGIAMIVIVRKRRRKA